MGVFDVLKSPTDRFAAKVIQALKAAAWPHEVQYLRSRFALITDDRGSVLHLGGVYADWRASPRRARGAGLQQVVGAILASKVEETYDEAAPRLLPAVRNLADLRGVALDAADPSLEIWQPWRRIAGPLAAIVVVDHPGSISFVQHARMDAWGVTFETLLNRAIDNLVARSPVSFKAMAGGFYVSDYGDRYDSSRLLLPELFLALQLRGDPVAVAISREEVVVAGSEDIPALNAMAAHVVEAMSAADRPTSWAPLILQDREWRCFDAPLTDDLRALRELALSQDFRDYKLQEPRLERYLASCGEDVYVAPHEVVLHEGDPFAWTSWTERVRALLPKVHGVGMTDAQGRALFRSWEDIEKVCGPFDADDSFHPPRFRPPAWPGPEPWRRLKLECAAPAWGVSDQDTAPQNENGRD